MSVKMDKINKDIAKAEQIITEWQGKLKALHKEKTDIENLEMIDILRKNKVNHNDLRTMLDVFQEENGTVVPLKTEIMEEKDIEKI